MKAVFIGGPFDGDRIPQQDYYPPQIQRSFFKGSYILERFNRTTSPEGIMEETAEYHWRFDEQPA